MQGAVHFKIVKYERIKFLVIGLENSIGIYAWAPKPYHKFMSFKVGIDLSMWIGLEDVIGYNEVRELQSEYGYD